MKKFVIMLMVVCSMLTFTGCQKKQECDWCGEMKKCTEYKDGDMLIMTLCDDCYEEMRADFL